MSKLSDIKISVPTKLFEIPSTGTRVKLRPFRVGDEKALLLASESDDTSLVIETLKKLIENNVEGEYKVDELAYFDIEALFLQLRAFSVGETSDILLGCGKCGEQTQVKIDVTDYKIQKQDDLDPVIKISDTFGFKMKFSKIEDMIIAQEKGGDEFVKLIAKSVEVVFNGDDVIAIGKDEIEDLCTIIEELTNKQFEKITDYISGQPKIVKEVKFKCKSCEEENTVELKGLSNFF